MTASGIPVDVVAQVLGHKDIFYVDRKGARTEMSIDNAEKFVARYGRKAHEQSEEVPEHLSETIIIPTF